VRDGDFTSAHFLGLRPSGTSAALTTGRPAVVEEHEAGRSLALTMARRIGTTDAVLTRTSLHGLVDALATREPGSTILLDEAIYPISQWAAGAVSFAQPGAHPMTFRHHDADDAARKAARLRNVVLVTDGLCGSCLKPAPLRDLAEVARRHDGELVVDDTLAAGVLGARAGSSTAFGIGGGGTAAWLGVGPGLTVASLAKGLSAPLAVIAGTTARIERVRRDGPARVHAGPPTAADISALRSAIGERTLDARRQRLARMAARVRRALDELELRPLGVPFPVVATEGGRSDPLAIHRALAASGIRSLATTSRCTGRATLTLCVRADQRNAEFDRLERALRTAVMGRAA
jgi:8-amino-7-oxononanoate synthase